MGCRAHVPEPSGGLPVARASARAGCNKGVRTTLLFSVTALCSLLMCGGRFIFQCWRMTEYSTTFNHY